jgi:hypothetical protein
MPDDFPPRCTDGVGKQRERRRARGVVEGIQNFVEGMRLALHAGESVEARYFRQIVSLDALCRGKAAVADALALKRRIRADVDAHRPGIPWLEPGVPDTRRRSWSARASAVASHPGARLAELIAFSQKIMELRA